MSMALRIDGMKLEQASDNLRNNQELVRIACQQNGMALTFGSSYVKSKDSVCIEACVQNPQARQFIDPSLLSNKGFMKSLVRA